MLVLEPSLPGGAAKTSRKGCGEFELVVHGVAGARRARSGQGRERHPRAGPADPRRRAAPGSEPRHHRERRRRSPAARAPTSSPPRRAPRSTSGCRRMADADAARSGACAGCGRRRRGTSLEVRGGFDRPPLERTRGRRSSLRAGARGGRDARARPAGRRRGRRVGREFHGGARCSDLRRPRARGRRRPRAARARRSRRILPSARRLLAGLLGRLAAGLDTDKIKRYGKRTENGAAARPAERAAAGDRRAGRRRERADDRLRLRRGR